MSKTDESFITLPRVAEIMCCSRRTVYYWVHTGTLKAYQRHTTTQNSKRKRLLFKESDVLALLSPIILPNAETSSNSKESDG